MHIICSRIRATQQLSVLHVVRCKLCIICNVALECSSGVKHTQMQIFTHMCVHIYQSIVRFKTLAEKRNSLFHDNAISLNKKLLATLFIRYESHEIETESNCLSPKNYIIFKPKLHDKLFKLTIITHRRLEYYYVMPPTSSMYYGNLTSSM